MRSGKGGVVDEVVGIKHVNISHSTHPQDALEGYTTLCTNEAVIASDRRERGNLPRSCNAFGDGFATLAMTRLLVRLCNLSCTLSDTLLSVVLIYWYMCNYAYSQRAYDGKAEPVVRVGDSSSVGREV